MRVRFMNNKMILIPVFMVSMIVFCVPLQAQGSEDFREDAIKKIQRTPTSYEELSSHFYDLLQGAPKEHFKKYFEIMFTKSFPPQKHSDAAVLKGWRCLYSKMAYANSLTDINKAVELQLEGINELLFFHKKSLYANNEHANTEIPSIGCSNCTINIKAEFMGADK